MKNITRLLVAAALTLFAPAVLNDSIELLATPRTLVAVPNNVPQCPLADPTCSPME